MGLVFSSGPVWAKDGFYVGMDLGVAVAPGLDVNSSDNDVGTTCDGFINRDESGNYRMPPPANANCSNPDPTAWSNKFDGGVGILAGASLGYRMGSFRTEAEYFYRGTNHDSTDPNTRVGDEDTTRKLKQELAITEGAVDDVLSHNFFANLYYDYRSDSKFTPYVGFGVGFARVSLDYLSVWTRRVDPERITTFADTENFDEDAYYAALEEGRAPSLQPCQSPTCEELHRQLAGTTTIGRGKLSDTLFGYQVLAGVDYQVSEPVTIGLKFRWADFGEFESDPREWNQLRSHDSARSPGGARVQYKVMTDDIQFWGVSLNMKYQF